MDKNRIYVLMVAGIILLFIGGFIGWKLKKCPIIVSTVTNLDTVYYPIPLVSKIIETKPVNVPYPVKGDIREIHDTSFLDREELPTYKSDDTLRYSSIDGTDSFYVAVSDLGNCYGIIERKSTFGGNLTGRIITKETINNIEVPPPFISLSAGVSTSFSTRWKAFDVGPAISLSIRKKHSATYSYGLNTSTHNFTLQTQIR